MPRLLDWLELLSPEVVLLRRSVDTALTARGCGVQVCKGGSDASLDVAYRRGPANCRGASLRSRSKRSGPIAFARSLRPVAEYFGPKARCGGNRHRAGGQSQAGLSTADSSGGPLRQGAHCE